MTRRGRKRIRRRLANQVASGFTVFLAFVFDFRVVVAPGLTLMGLPARAAGGATASSGSGPPWKNLRHSGESCDLFSIMQAVMRSTSGI